MGEVRKAWERFGRIEGLLGEVRKDRERFGKNRRFFLVKIGKF